MYAEPSVEEWRVINGWPYEVSNQGRVRPLKWSRSNPNRRPLKPDVDKYGYHVYTLMHNKVKIRLKLHRIICEAWNGPPPYPEAQARHLDDNKNNNDPSNIAWGTGRDNAQDAYRNGSRKFGDEHHRAIYTEELIHRLRNEHARALLGRRERAPRGWISQMANKYGLSRSQVIYIVLAAPRKSPPIHYKRNRRP